MTEKEAERNRKSAKPVIEAFRVISGGKWKWGPEPGEWCVYEEDIFLVVRVYDDGAGKLIDVYDETTQKPECFRPEDVTPILECEEIKRVLEGMGYIVKVREQEDFGEDCKYNCGIYTDKLGVGASAPTRYESVVNSLLELAKDLKKKK